MRLSRATLPQVPAAIAAPRERPEGKIGIVHFGPGAFHRAHQATYIDDLLARDPDWGIAAVSLRSAGTVEALAAQDGLYTLAVRDAEPAMRIIGAHKRFLGPDDHAEVAALLADPDVRLVTMTVTEKGYCQRAIGPQAIDPCRYRPRSGGRAAAEHRRLAGGGSRRAPGCGRCPVRSDAVRQSGE
jgi:fructuronate reductase